MVDTISLEADAEADAERFPLEETRRLVRGLFEPNPLIYWADFLFSIVVGWTAFVVAAMSEPFSACRPPVTWWHRWRCIDL